LRACAPVGGRLDHLADLRVERPRSLAEGSWVSRILEHSGRLTLARTVSLAEPLQGAVERLGRIVDRLPGGRRA